MMDCCKRKTMRFFTLYLLLFLTLDSFSANYYFSSSSGSDSYSAAQAQNRNTPWKSIEKLNNSMSLFRPGDSILFKRGDVFYGQIILEVSGTAGNPIVFGAYGTGRNPALKGSVPVTGWATYRGSIWVANCPQLGIEVTDFYVNGVPQQLGRYPNAETPDGGYLNIDAHIGQTSLTSSSLASTPNWNGGEAVFRVDRWTLNSVGIRTHQGTTLTFSESATKEIKDNYGFFIQNHLNTLDKNGEWYYDVVNKRIYLYYTTNPNSFNSEATLHSSIFEAIGKQHFTIRNIDFSGSLTSTLNMVYSHHIQIANNTFFNTGNNGVYFYGCIDVSFINNRISDINNSALIFDQCRSVLVQDNEIRRVGLRAGMGANHSYIGMYLAGSNIQCESNRIDSIGYSAVVFNGDTIAVKRNYISNFCMTIDDGGGIYTSGDGQVFTNRSIEDNIIMYGIGAGKGTSDANYLAAEGIYADSRSNHILIKGNTIAHCSNHGLFIQNSNHITISNNTVYNSSDQIIFRHSVEFPNYPIRNCIVNNNIFFSKSDSQFVAKFVTIKDDIAQFGLFYDNYYCRPIRKDDIIQTVRQISGSNIVEVHNLSTWQKKYNFDLGSSNGNISIRPFSVLNFIGSNKVSNGRFDSSINEWTYWSNYGNGRVSWDNSSSMDGGSMRLDFPTASSNEASSYLIAVGEIGQVNAGENYVMRFSMLTDRSEQQARITLQQSSTPFTILDPIQIISTGNDRIEYTLLFTPELSEQDAAIVFRVPESEATHWIDNVELYQSNIQMSNIDDSLVFISNPTLNPIHFNDGRMYMDVYGNQSFDFSLGSYSSLILSVMAGKAIEQVLVTDITVSGVSGISTISTNRGTLQLSALVLPSNATNKMVSWSIQNGTGQATISSTGLVTALTNGTVTAIATAKDGSGVQGRMNISISGQNISVVSISITPSTGDPLISQTGGTLQLTASVMPANASNRSITWSIINGSGQAVINSSGLVTAVSNGTVTVRATANDGSGVSGSLVITISNQVVSVSEISVETQNGETSISINHGTLQMIAIVQPDNATVKRVTWSVIPGTGQAEVSPAGLLTALADGTVRVKATANDGSGTEGILDISISNQAIAVSEIIVTGESGKDSITMDDGVLKMVAEIIPANASNQAVFWRIENLTGKASINLYGELKAIANGAVRVLADASDGSGITGSCIVQISNQVEKPELFDKDDYAYYTVQQGNTLLIKYFHTDFIGKTCAIYSISGVLKYKALVYADPTEINVSSFSSGIYIIELYDSQSSITFKTMIR